MAWNYHMIKMENSLYCLVWDRVFPPECESWDQGTPELCSGSAWCLTFAFACLRNLSFCIESYAGHPRFHRFSVLGTFQFFLEHSFGIYPPATDWVICFKYEHGQQFFRQLKTGSLTWLARTPNRWCLLSCQLSSFLKEGHQIKESFLHH